MILNSADRAATAIPQKLDLQSSAQSPPPETGRRCCKKGSCDRPCTCAMGNVSRFIEPVVLRILKERKKSYGYEIAESLARYALTDATIEGAALYRTLRTLEANGYVSSAWAAGDGPARRIYSLTSSGHAHLRDWARLLDSLGKAMIDFSRETSRGNNHEDCR